MDCVGDCPEKTSDDKAYEPPQGLVPDNESHSILNKDGVSDFTTVAPGHPLLLDVKRLQLDHERCCRNEAAGCRLLSYCSYQWVSSHSRASDRGIENRTKK